MDAAINEVDRALCATCYDSLRNFFENYEIPIREPLKQLMEKNVSCPMFVTWFKVNPNGTEQLRGCLGTLEPVSIVRIAYYARASALDDERFDPLEEAEIPKLNCALSLLHSFEKAADPYDWVVGKHGIMITFEHEGKEYNATYLPEVAQENGLTKEATLNQLIRKAGYKGKITDEIMDNMKVGAM
ncbi:Uncharacterized protein BXIN_2375 [Babesia sp. Xinjiang]|uniref:Uncharacterized protein n=1 Tax=Babesia sp. Xinjiang TaxID=462227 RepID=UPI000A24A101|nr:Uncharacterized protein BXIN_2375 [Babesia sp. Xinjiang]ORM40704.1 Uncharacterized protein BXIN_2375 [Babesia sp. Xinjiang]